MPRPLKDKDLRIKNYQVKIEELNAKIAMLNYEIKTGNRMVECVTEDRVRSLHKKPDYYFTWSAFPIIRQWIYWNGLRLVHAEILIILSYYKYALLRDLQSWNLHKLFYEEPLQDVIKMGYVVVVTVPGKSNIRMRKAYALTQKGLDLEADYEKFYDQKTKDFKEKIFSDPIVNNPNDYFRRVRLFRHGRRLAQGGGMLPKGGSKMIRFMDRKGDEDGHI